MKNGWLGTVLACVVMAFVLFTAIAVVVLMSEADPPDEVFGAKRSFCQEGPAAICCGYDGVDHEGDPCGVVICRANDSNEWHIVMARCFRAKPKAEQPPKVEESI